MNINAWLRKRRYGEIIRVSLPLVMSMAATMVMEFVDRLFLANYSLDAIAAAWPAGMAAFLLLTFFAGVTGYLTVFVAQYTGAGIREKIGACLWQGIWFSLFSALVLAGISFFSVPLFRLGGHAPEIQVLEVAYFRILCLGGGVNVLVACLGCFFSGRGITRPLMLISVSGMLFNIPLDYILIYGVWIIPEMGIRGAAMATVASWGIMAGAFSVLIFTQRNNRQFGVWRSRAFNRELFGRLLKYGIPGAMQFCADVFAFTFFVFMVGRIGKHELAITNIVLSINSIAFMPTMGFSFGVNILTGQAIGKNQPEEAVLIANTTIHILLVYCLSLNTIFLFAPENVLALFISENQYGVDYAALIEKGATLLHFVACYIVFDALYMTYTGLLKGAGDTRFIMWSMGVLSFLTLILPVYVGVEYFGAGLRFTWSCITLFVLSMCVASFARYRQGKWKTMRVIGGEDFDD